MARFLYCRDHQTLESDDWPPSSDALWVDLGPEDQGRVREVVQHLYSAHPAVMRHLLHGDSHRPNLLVDNDAISFMLALIPVEPDRPLHHLSFVIGEHFLVTAHLADASHVVDHAYAYVQNNHLLDEGVDFALYEVLIRHVVALREMANHLDAEFEHLHRVLLKHPYKNMSNDILALRKRAMAAKHVLNPEGTVFELLKSSDMPYVQKNNRPYFEEASFVMDEVVSEVQGIREGLAEMVEAYTSLQSNEINLVMRFLTVLSVLALPATTIASIYGMNFDIPEIHWKYGYFYSLTVMALVTILLLLLMKKRSGQG